ncbi:MAG: Na(+)/H(+) antiporter subunit B [Firmicutes bacterium]|nr:Na(+)/H(+) antiporter subunit B [Bacillota bacterium]MBQ3198782.1 Na(+)/H(+) antiporter subunit B [Bacillota bacterium]
MMVNKNTESSNPLGELIPEMEKREERIETSKVIEAVENDYEPKGGGINNILLKTASMVVICFIMLAGLYILVAGHNAPGGGFIAGLMIAGGMVLLYLCFGKPFPDAMRVSPRILLPMGLTCALGTGVAGTLFGMPFLTHAFGHVHIPFFGNWELTSASVFDFGVFLVVIGTCMTIILNIGENK